MSKNYINYATPQAVKKAGRYKRGSSCEQDYIYYLASVTLLHQQAAICLGWRKP